MGASCSAQPKVKTVSKESNIQDEARSYRSKIGANRIILKNEHTRKVFVKYCEAKHKSEYVQYFHELDEIKTLPLDELKRKMKELFVAVDANDTLLKEKQKLHGSGTVDDGESDIVVCLRQLRTLNLETSTFPQIMKVMNSTQDVLLSRVAKDFEEFLKSPQFQECRNFHVESRVQAHPPHSSNSPPSSQKRLPPVKTSTGKEDYTSISIH
jgi:hypothetical protein